MTERIELADESALDGCEATLPLADYVRKMEEDPEACAPCNLAVIVPWYREVLRQEGFGELAGKVDSLADGNPEPLDVASALDNIRESVQDGPVKRTLLMYNCMMQSYQEPTSEV